MTQLTERGAYVVASTALVILATLLVIGQIHHPDRQTHDAPGIVPMVMQCGEGLDGMPGISCFRPGDAPTNN